MGSTNEDMATLNTVQSVLRGLTVGLAAAGRMDMPLLASTLQAFAEQYLQQDPQAQAMLLDLAHGLDVLGMGATH